jgi:molybdenum transport protein
MPNRDSITGQNTFKFFFMFYFTDHEIDQLITEDVPYADLSTSLLKLENKAAKIQVFTHADAVICCTEEVMKIFNRTGVQTTLFTPSGEFLEKGVKFLEGEGLSGTLFSIARTIENLLVYSSGIATRTKQFTEKARNKNRHIIVAASRKTIPYTRKISIKAIKAGGAAIYRSGLSESVVIYGDHYRFLGGLKELEKRIAERKALAGGRPFTIEVKSPADALIAAHMNADVIQMNGFSPAEIKKIKKEKDKLNVQVKLAAAGNITLKNVEEYAVSGADILVTSWPYYGEPADMTVSVQPIFDQILVSLTFYVVKSTPSPRQRGTSWPQSFSIFHTI